jgi:hypothetical protein
LGSTKRDFTAVCHHRPKVVADRCKIATVTVY